MIPRVSKIATHGARGFDTVSKITRDSAAALVAAGMNFGCRYLGDGPNSLTSEEIDAMIGAGLAVSPVTYGGDFDPIAAVARAQRIGLPKATTIWLDVEGQTGDADALIAKINGWASVVRKAWYDPGIYVGADALLTSAELFALDVDRYWKSMSRVEDRNGLLAEPRCGWCMTQFYPSAWVAGVWVDFDAIGKDYKNRLPTWCAAA